MVTGSGKKRLAVIAHRRSWGASSLPRGALDADFPDPGGTHIVGVFSVTYGLARGFGQKLRIIEPPQKDVCVEQ